MVELFKRFMTPYRKSVAIDTVLLVASACLVSYAFTGTQQDFIKIFPPILATCLFYDLLMRWFRTVVEEKNNGDSSVD